MTNTFKFLIVVLFLFSLRTYPHGSHHHHHQCGHSCSHGQTSDPEKEAQEIDLHGVSDNELRELMDNAHHAIENDDSTFWEKVKGKANFKKITLNAYRWASENEDRPEVSNARANIAVMLLASHWIETIGGLAMAGYGVSNGLETWSDKLMTVAGLLIPIPGLDPMCIVLMSTYAKFPGPLNRMLTKPRVILLRGASAVNAMAGLPDGWVDSAYSSVSKKKFLQDYLKGGEAYSHRVIFNEYLFQIHGTQPGQTIELTMSRMPSGILALTKVRFSERAPAMVRTYMGQLLKPFGWNIKSLVLEVDRAIADGKFERLAQQNYIQRVDPLSDRYTVFLKPGAFPFHNLHESDFNCEAQLMEKRAQRR